jgi:hypothetical protein
MKLFFQTRFSLVWLAAFALFATVASCSKDGIFKDVVVYVRTDIMLNPMTIQLVDANPNNGQVDTSKLEIEVLGRDRAKIYSVVGKKQLTNDGRYINIGIRRIDNPTADAPLSFGVRVKANGYAEAIKWFSITNGEKRQAATMELVKLSAPPPNVSVLTTSFTTTANGLATDLVFETVESANNPQKARVMLKAGTRLYLQGTQTEAIGDVKATLVFFNQNTQNLFPTGGIGLDVVESNGKPKKPGAAVSPGYTSLEMTVNGGQIGTFSAPIEASCTFDPTVVNPESGAVIAVGDNMPIWSLKEPELVWTGEDTTKIITQNGKLWAVWPQSHLSFWACSWFIEGTPLVGYDGGANGTTIPPTVRPILTVQSNILPNAVCNTGGAYFYSEIAVAQAPSVVLHSNSFQYYNGQTFLLSDYLSVLPKGGIVWRIYSGASGQDCTKGTLLYESPAILGTSTLNIASSLPNDGLEVSLIAEGVCGTNDIIIPTTTVYVREEGTDCTRVLGDVLVGKGCAGGIYKGKTYYFSVHYGGLNLETPAIKIPATDETLTLNSPGLPENFQIAFVYSGTNQNELKLELTSIQLPDDLCDEFKKFLE